MLIILRASNKSGAFTIEDYNHKYLENSFDGFKH